MQRQKDKLPQGKIPAACVKPRRQIHCLGLSIGNLSLSSQKRAELVPDSGTRQQMYLTSSLGRSRKTDRQQVRLILKYTPQMGPLMKRSMESEEFMYSPFLGHHPEAAQSCGLKGSPVRHPIIHPGPEKPAQMEAGADEVKCIRLGIQYKNQPLFSDPHQKRGRLYQSGASGSQLKPWQLNVRTDVASTPQRNTCLCLGTQKHLFPFLFSGKQAAAKEY